MDRAFIKRVLEGRDPEWDTPEPFTGSPADDEKVKRMMALDGDRVVTDICVEECAELIKEITKADRYWDTCGEYKQVYLKEGLEEEVADMFIIINYLFKRYGLRADNISRIMSLKFDYAFDLMEKQPKQENSEE